MLLYNMTPFFLCPCFCLSRLLSLWLHAPISHHGLSHVSLSAKISLYPSVSSSRQSLFVLPHPSLSSHRLPDTFVCHKLMLQAFESIGGSTLSVLLLMEQEWRALPCIDTRGHTTTVEQRDKNPVKSVLPMITGFLLNWYNTEVFTCLPTDEKDKDRKQKWVKISYTEILHVLTQRSEDLRIQKSINRALSHLQNTTVAQKSCI